MRLRDRIGIGPKSVPAPVPSEPASGSTLAPMEGCAPRSAAVASAARKFARERISYLPLKRKTYVNALGADGKAGTRWEP